MKLTSNADVIARRIFGWSKRVTPAMAEATLKTSTLLVWHAKRTAPVRTARLRRSISYVAGGEARYIVGPHVPYAAAVHGGTRPHTIVPSVKQALFWKGARHPVRRVNHPGTKGDPFMTRALERAQPTMREIMRKTGASIVTSRG